MIKILFTWNFCEFPQNTHTKNPGQIPLLHCSLAARIFLTFDIFRAVCLADNRYTENIFSIVDTQIFRALRLLYGT